ncbi:hypothetical protein [Paenibacillus sp. 37]|uniref:hypothetical protein n=1 Tax=Paenibacillus sp. 37 TaxID=2607911 RepID=UPI00122E3230|nr:hypothetical protein [Paenibacillus sp. 37]
MKIIGDLQKDSSEVTLAFSNVSGDTTVTAEFAADRLSKLTIGGSNFTTVSLNIVHKNTPWKSWVGKLTKLIRLVFLLITIYPHII